MIRMRSLAATLGAVMVMVMVLGGCEPVRTKVADFISPEKAEETLKAADAHLAAGRYKEAREKAQALADQTGPLQPQFALTVARASAYAGDPEAALKYLGQAMLPLALTPDAVMADQAFESLHTDLRFLQLITGQTQAQPAPSRDISISAGADTQININSRTMEVKAGDVVIKLPN